MTVPPAFPPMDAPLAPPEVSPSRVLATLVGLRPYRPSGFVVRAERTPAGKTLVHDYGHGGCGVTLGWGTAELALEALAAASDARRVAVIGAGVAGLTMAATLQRAGREVTVYADAVSPDTTSDVAGAIWSPFLLYDEAAAAADVRARVERAARLAHARLREQAGEPGAGVRWVRLFTLYEDAPPPMTALEADPALYPGHAADPLAAERFGVAHARSHRALMIDPDVFLPALMRGVEANGGAIVRRRFESAAEIDALPEPAVVNCAGLGAGALFGDPEIAPARGQMTLIAPQPEVDYGYRMRSRAAGLLYMYPRVNGLLLGGTVEQGVWDRAVDASERDRVLREHAAIAARLRGRAGG